MQEIRASVIYRDGPLTAEDYDEAIQALQDAKTQLEPDGGSCTICTDSDHQAGECHHNPLVMARRQARHVEEWRCFHCGEQFIDRVAAAEHFGLDPVVVPACQHIALCPVTLRVCEALPWR